MYTAVLVTLLVASLGMNQVPEAAGPAATALVVRKTSDPGDEVQAAKVQGLRKGGRDLKRANDQELARWSQYQPKTAARKTWKKLLADTPVVPHERAILPAASAVR